MRKKRKKSAEVRVLFDRKHTATKSLAKNRRKGSVTVEVYYDRKRTYFPTGIRVFTDQFKNGRVCNHGEAANYNERIRLVTNAIEDYINNVLRDGKTFDLERLKEYMTDAGVSNDNSFLDFMEKSIAERDIAGSTRVKHENVFRRLKAWGKIRSFTDVNADNIKAWHQEAVRAAVKSAFTVNYDRVLRIYVRMAVQKGLVKDNPYNYWKVPKYTPAQTHRNISLDEVRLIEGVELTQKFEIMSRDLFMFQANTGMSYIDTQTFDTKMVRKIGGHLAYMNSRVKTTEPFYIPLNDTARGILKKYGGTPPVLGLEAYNVDLKRVAKKAGVELPISSHWARHTFATICLNNGMSISVLSKILGHSDIATTQIYAQMQQDTINSEFDKAMENIKKDGAEE